MKILLTGSSGFIGKNLKEKLQNQYHVNAPVKQELDLFDENAVRDYLYKEKFDLIIHAASINVRNKEATNFDFLDGNLRMFFNLERCKDLYGKMYYFGSGAEYDMRYYCPDMKEKYFGKHIPVDPYGFSKYVMSKICENRDDIYDLRLFGVFGKYEVWERRFISNAICRVLKGKDITIQKNVYFDYLWVDDLCDIMQWFIENNPVHKHYNVCTGKKVDLYTLACVVRETLNVKCHIQVEESGWKPEYTGNNERLLKEIGEYHFTDYRSAISQLCEYYRENIALIDEDKLI